MEERGGWSDTPCRGCGGPRSSRIARFSAVSDASFQLWFRRFNGEHLSCSPESCFGTFLFFVLFLFRVVCVFCV